VTDRRVQDGPAPGEDYGDWRSRYEEWVGQLSADHTKTVGLASGYAVVALTEHAPGGHFGGCAAQCYEAYHEIAPWPCGEYARAHEWVMNNKS
jgi:hypothetical protein